MPSGILSCICSQAVIHLYLSTLSFSLKCLFTFIHSPAFGWYSHMVFLPFTSRLCLFKIIYNMYRSYTVGAIQELRPQVKRLNDAQSVILNSGHAQHSGFTSRPTTQNLSCISAKSVLPPLNIPTS